MSNYSSKELKSMIKEAEKKEKEKNKVPFNKGIVALVLTLNMVFTGIILYLYFKGGNEPEVLIKHWFRFTGTELVALAGIKGLDTVKEIVEAWKEE